MHITLEIKNLFDDIILRIGRENLGEFSNCSLNNLTDYHFTIGLYLRNKIKNNAILTDFFNKLNVTNTDDISHILLLFFWHYLH